MDNNKVINTVELLSGSLGYAWEDLLLTVWDTGRTIETEYNEQSYDLSPASVEIAEPLSLPVVHRGFPAWHKKDSYAHDLINGGSKFDESASVAYTYHGRLFEYPNPPPWGDHNAPVSFDQIERIIGKLQESPHSRRAQAITWYPRHDWVTDSPPCLQRLWFRIVDGKLDCHTHWRSRDLFKAWWTNAYGMISLQHHLSIILEVGMGHYFDISDSLHIYEGDWKDARQAVKIIRSRPERERFQWSETFKLG